MRSPLSMQVNKTGAEQEASVCPVPEPAHVHIQGPVPETAEDVPAEQRLLVGIEETATPLAEPQAPLTVAANLVAVQVPLSAPPFNPKQIHVEVEPPDSPRAVGGFGLAGPDPDAQ